MSIVSFLSALALISRLLLVVSGSAPGDEHEYCVNTVNVDEPPSAREPGRNILLDTYNYAALLTRVSSFTNPSLETFPPVFQRFDLDGSSPTLEWRQFRTEGNCRLQVNDCKFGNVNNPPPQDNWLVTQFIRLDTSHEALRVFVNHSITLCNGTVVCRDSYSVFVFPANEGTNITLQTLTSNTASAVATFAETDDTRTHTRYASFRVDGYDGFYVALRSKDTCVMIHRLQVLYWTCPGGVQGLAEVDGSSEQHESQTFRCIGNSTQLVEGNRLTCFVEQNGRDDEYTEWRLLGGDEPMSINEVCRCDPGFQLSNETPACIECPKGTFKEGYSNDPCASCPEHSFTNSAGSASCQCVEGRYRGTTESASLPCALPPSAPNNLTLIDIDRRSVLLSWDPPQFNGSRGSFFYTIWHRRVEDTQWTRGGTVMNENSPVVNYTLSGLIPHSQHIVRVTADSNATDTVPEELAHLRSLNLTLMTLPDVPGKGSPPLLSSTLYTDSITVTLVAPEYPNGVITQYNIRWYREGQEDSAQVVTVPGTQQSYTLSGLTPGTYYVQVQAVSAQGSGTYSDPASFTVESFPAGFIGAIAAGAVLICCGLAVLVVLTLMIGHCCKIRRKYQSTRKLAAEEAERAELVSFTSNGASAANPEAAKKKNYVDPRNYASTYDALVEFAKEIPPHEMNLQNVIGSGEFGDVLVGYWYKPKSVKPIKVAVKTLKDGSPKKAREDFLTEATIMGQFDDDNVIHLHGVVSKSRPVMIVMEFMDNGSLEGYLKQNDGLFDTHRLVKMATGVASGMRYLAGMGFVHRDLAARNVLVDSAEVCKISDFGLSRETEENVYNVKTGGKIPVRWTPPEAIHFRKFSEKSDVWSFGVLLWEVMSYGAQPYADWGNQQVLREVDKGYRLPCPEISPDSVYQVMLSCWQKESVRRPTFAQCKDTLEDLMQNNFTHLTKPPRARKEVRSPLSYNSVQEWLEDLKMVQYVPNFVDVGLTLKECCSLTEADVETLGVAVAGHRHKIFASIQCADGGELPSFQ